MSRLQANPGKPRRGTRQPLPATRGGTVFLPPHGRGVPPALGTPVWCDGTLRSTAETTWPGFHSLLPGHPAQKGPK